MLTKLKIGKAMLKSQGSAKPAPVGLIAILGRRVFGMKTIGLICGQIQQQVESRWAFHAILATVGIHLSPPVW